MAHSVSGTMVGQLPLAAPSFFFNVFLMILLIASTCPLDCRCARDAKKMLMLKREQRCQNREQLNCLPLSVTMAFGRPDRHRICRYCCEGLGLSPFGKVIDGYDCEFKLTCALWHWADVIESPLGKWPRASHRTEWFGRDFRYRSETLARIAPLHNLGGVSVESWPIIAFPNGLEGQGSGSQVVTIRAFVNLT
ncbi:unnamed protein product [Prunus armeniaca]